MTAPGPKRRSTPSTRYTPPRPAAEGVRSRATAVRVVAALVILAMVLAPLAFLFAAL